jgi:hypothetical protein
MGWALLPAPSWIVIPRVGQYLPAHRLSVISQKIRHIPLEKFQLSSVLKQSSRKYLLGLGDLARQILEKAGKLLLMTIAYRSSYNYFMLWPNEKMR